MSNFLEHCQLLEELNYENADYELLEELPSVSKERFAPYNIECKHFEEMYLNVNEKGKELLSEKTVQETKKPRKVAKKKECSMEIKKSRIIGELASNLAFFQFKMAYFSASFTHMCLFPGKYANVLDTGKVESVRCHLTGLLLMLARI